MLSQENIDRFGKKKTEDVKMEKEEFNIKMKECIS